MLKYCKLLPDCFQEIVCLKETSERQELRRMSPKCRKSKLFLVSLSFCLVTISLPHSTFHWFSLIEACCRLVVCLHTISVLTGHRSPVLSPICFGVPLSALVPDCRLSERTGLTWDWGKPAWAGDSGSQQAVAGSHKLGRTALDSRLRLSLNMEPSTHWHDVYCFVYH